MNGQVDDLNNSLYDGDFMFTSESVGEGHPGKIAHTCTSLVQLNTTCFAKPSTKGLLFHFLDLHISIFCVLILPSSTISAFLFFYFFHHVTVYS